MTFQLSGKAREIYERVMLPLWLGRWAARLSNFWRCGPARLCWTPPVEELAADVEWAGFTSSPA